MTTEEVKSKLRSDYDGHVIADGRITNTQITIWSIQLEKLCQVWLLEYDHGDGWDMMVPLSDRNDVAATWEALDKYCSK